MLFQADHSFIQAQQVHENNVIRLDILVQQVVVGCNSGGGDTKQKAGETTSESADLFRLASSSRIRTGCHTDRAGGQLEHFGLWSSSFFSLVTVCRFKSRFNPGMVRCSQWATLNEKGVMKLQMMIIENIYVHLRF